MKVNDTEVNLNSLMTPIGNVLAGLALGFLIDRLALGGTVAASLPTSLVEFVGILIFVGAVVYGFRLAKKAN